MELGPLLGFLKKKNTCNFVNWQCKAFAQFYGSSEMKKGSSYKKL